MPLAQHERELARELVGLDALQRRRSPLWLRLALVVASAAVAGSLLADGVAETWEVAVVIGLVLVQPLAFLNWLKTLQQQHAAALALLQRELEERSP